MPLEFSNIPTAISSFPTIEPGANTMPPAQSTPLLGGGNVGEALFISKRTPERVWDRVQFYVADPTAYARLSGTCRAIRGRVLQRHGLSFESVRTLMEFRRAESWCALTRSDFGKTKERLLSAIIAACASFSEASVYIPRPIAHEVWRILGDAANLKCAAEQALLQRIVKGLTACPRRGLSLLAYLPQIGSDPHSRPADASIANLWATRNFSFQEAWLQLALPFWEIPSLKDDVDLVVGCYARRLDPKLPIQHSEIWNCILATLPVWVTLDSMSVLGLAIAARKGVSLSARHCRDAFEQRFACFPSDLSLDAAERKMDRFLQSGT